MTGIPNPGNLRRILCEGTALDEYVQFSSRAEKEAFQNVSCSLTPQQLMSAQQELLQNLDPSKMLSVVSFSSSSLQQLGSFTVKVRELCSQQYSRTDPVYRKVYFVYPKAQKTYFR